MPDYRDGKIYAIHCLTSGDQYIGSTTRSTLAQRLSQHKSQYSQYCKGSKVHKLTSHEIIKTGNYRIELIEAYPCESKDELHAREGHYIRTLECVNKIVPGRTGAEYRADNKDKIAEHKKQYRVDNKAFIAKRDKQYAAANKDKISEHKKQYRVDNKDKLNEYNVQYRAKNAYAIAERKKSHVTCECGCVMARGSLAVHVKSKKHHTLLDKINNDPILLQAIAHDI